MMLMDIKKLSEYLGIKPKTLYTWAAQGKIPSIKIHRLLRFDKEEIDTWLLSFKRELEDLSSWAKTKLPGSKEPYPHLAENVGKDGCDEFIENLVSKAIQSPYNRRRRETRPSPSPKREAKDGAV